MWPLFVAQLVIVNFFMQSLSSNISVCHWVHPLLTHAHMCRFYQPENTKQHWNNSNKNCCSVRIYCKLFDLKVHHLWIHPCSMPGCATYFLFHLFLSVVYSLVGTSTPGASQFYHSILTTKQYATATRTRTADVWPLLCCKKLVTHRHVCSFSNKSCKFIIQDFCLGTVTK